MSREYIIEVRAKTENSTSPTNRSGVKSILTSSRSLTIPLMTCAITCPLVKVETILLVRLSCPHSCSPLAFPTESKLGSWHDCSNCYTASYKEQTMLGIIGDITCIAYLASLPFIVYFYDNIVEFSFNFYIKALENDPRLWPRHPQPASCWP